MMCNTHIDFVWLHPVRTFTYTYTHTILYHTHTHTILVDVIHIAFRRRKAFQHHLSCTIVLLYYCTVVQHTHKLDYHHIQKKPLIIASDFFGQKIFYYFFFFLIFFWILLIQRSPIVRNKKEVRESNLTEICRRIRFYSAENKNEINFLWFCFCGRLQGFKDCVCWEHSAVDSFWKLAKLAVKIITGNTMYPIYWAERKYARLFKTRPFQINSLTSFFFNFIF